MHLRGDKSSTMALSSPSSGCRPDPHRPVLSIWGNATLRHCVSSLGGVAVDSFEKTLVKIIAIGTRNVFRQRRFLVICGKMSHLICHIGRHAARLALDFELVD